MSKNQTITILLLVLSISAKGEDNNTSTTNQSQENRVMQLPAIEPVTMTRVEGPTMYKKQFSDVEFELVTNAVKKLSKEKLKCKSMADGWLSSTVNEGNMATAKYTYSFQTSGCMFNITDIVGEGDHATKLKQSNQLKAQIKDCLPDVERIKLIL